MPSNSRPQSGWKGWVIRNRMSSPFALRVVEAEDEGRQAGREDDAAELPSFPFQRGAAVAERDRVQPGQFVAAAGAAAAGWQLVVDEPATTIGQDGWAAYQARPVLLAAAGGGAFDAAAFRGHGAADGGAPGAGRIGRSGGEANRSKEGEGRRGA